MQSLSGEVTKLDGVCPKPATKVERARHNMTDMSDAADHRQASVPKQKQSRAASIN